MPNEPIKIQELNSTLHELEARPCFQNAKTAAVGVINLLGIPSNLEFVPISKVPGTVANQLELAEGYADKRAAYKYNIQDTTPFDVKLFWVQKTSKRTVSSLAALTPNFEDEPFYTDKNIGIDIVTPRTTDRIFLIMSSSYNIRLVELKGGLTNTQKEIFAKWVQSFDYNNKRQIHTILWDSLDLKSLNESFYKEVTQFFSELKLHLKNTPLFDENGASHFVNRLIGRLIFCWFIRKRGLINEGKRYLEISPEEDSSTYYHNRLESLFFSVLNTPIEDRLFGDTETPFLNGGLFDPRDEDRKGNSLLTFPKDYFHRFFAFLNHYNFTTDESTSDYQQVAIDPEMLGKIFENLLAEQREDTGEQARKAKGAFYTPREIVDYMCRQSIREYLKGQLSTEEGVDEIISDLIDTREHAYDKNVRDKIAPYKTKLSSALDNVKIIDPACGSGAFPMGMLKLLEQLYERIDVRYEPHKTKLGVIKNNLFGVDIEPMAIEISRLRAWLSIIVDDDINPRLPNKGVEPLPNLDFKFVCANSLIGLDLKPKHEQLSLSGNALSDDELISKLKELREEWFEPRERDKTKIKKEFNEIQTKLFDSVIKDWNGTASREDKLKLVGWDPFSEKPANFFEPFWMFGLKDGFDIVIANPPYIRQEKIANQKVSLQGYEVYNSTSDLYTYFYERGFNLLKNGSILTFISSNKWIRAKYGEKLRRFLKKRTRIKQIIDFNGYKNFEATVDTNIITIQKEAVNADYAVPFVNIQDDFTGINLEAYLSANQQKIELSHLNDIGWSLVDKKTMTIKEKIEKIGTSLKDWGFESFMGIKTGFNEAFVINEDKRRELINEDIRNAKIIVPMLKGKDVRHYRIEFDKKYIILAKNGIDIKKEYPSIYKHLLQFSRELEKRWDKGRYWFNLRDCAYYDEFEKDKIVYPDIEEKLSFAFDEMHYYSDNTTYVLGTDNKYILSVLNSKLINFYYQCISSQLGAKAVRHFTIYIERIPIKQASEEEQKPFTEIVDKILASIKYDDYLENPVKKEEVKEYEKQIDQMVYKLYELTPEEIEIVETSSKK